VITLNNRYTYPQQEEGETVVTLVQGQDKLLKRAVDIRFIYQDSQPPAHPYTLTYE
jgi:hypothetical protein